MRGRYGSGEEHCRAACVGAGVMLGRLALPHWYAAAVARRMRSTGVRLGSHSGVAIGPWPRHGRQVAVLLEEVSQVRSISASDAHRVLTYLRRAGRVA